MIWYNMKNLNGIYIIFKNTEIGKGIACKGIFRGLKSECDKYCEEKGIKLGKGNGVVYELQR